MLLGVLVPLMLALQAAAASTAVLSAVLAAGTILPALLALSPVAAGSEQPLFQHQVQLDRSGDFVLRWNTGTEDIEMQVEVATRGYVGVGFSPTGGMKEADIILGWVDEAGQPHLSDRHGTGDETPQVDASQDVELLSASHNDTHTTLRFRRPLLPCDELHDLPITTSTMRVIWAYDGATSLSASMARLPHHDHRGTLSLYMAGGKKLDYDALQHVQTWDVLAPNVSLPNDVDTLYWCKMYKMPTLDRKHHLIGYEPNIADHMVPYVHHMILYECHAPGVDSSRHFERWVDQLGAQCYAANMPESWNGCNMPIVAWAVGSRGFSLPEEAGFPLGEEHNGATYFMLEIHYSNPNLNQNLVDSSGIRTFLTPKLRPYDAGVLQFGHNVDPFQIIPPSSKWKTTGHCHSECTRLTLPEDGIKIFSSFQHAHVLGTGVALQHIRGGLELPPVVEDDTYDFNFQQERELPQPRTVLPGDHLIVTCTYDATHKPATTYGGFETTDEMCLVFASYFPRQRLTECHSRPDVALLLDTLGVLDMRDNRAVLNAFQIRPFDLSTVIEESELARIGQMSEQAQAGANYHELILAHFFNTMIIDAPQELNGTTLLAFLSDWRTWQNATVLRTLQQRVTTGQYEPLCVYSGRGMPAGMPKKAKYPQYAPYVKPKKACKPVDIPSTSAAPAIHSPSMLNHRTDHQQSQSNQGPRQAFGFLPTVNQESSLHDQRSPKTRHQSFGYVQTIDPKSNFQDPQKVYETSGYQQPSVPHNKGFHFPSFVHQGSPQEDDRSYPREGDWSPLNKGGESPVDHHSSYEDNHSRYDHSPLQSPSSKDEYASFGDDIATIHEQLLKDVNQVPADEIYSFATHETRRTEEDPAGERDAAGAFGGDEAGARPGEGGVGTRQAALSPNTHSAGVTRSPHIAGLAAFLLTLFVR